MQFKFDSVDFVFTRQKSFVVPRTEYKFQAGRDFLLAKRKHISSLRSGSSETIVCIICHEEANPEDLVSLLCPEMHFVVCRGCVGDNKKNTDAVIECPFCIKKKRREEYHDEITEKLFSFQAQQTLCLEIRPDMKIEAAELTRETRVVLRNISISDKLFLVLMSRTTVEIQEGASLFKHHNGRKCCHEGLVEKTCGQIDIDFGSFSTDDVERIRENISIMPDNILHVKNIESWVLADYTLELLPKLKLHEENEMKALKLKVTHPNYMKRILGAKNHSIWMGKVLNLKLYDYAVSLLAKLRFHDNNAMDELFLRADNPENIIGISQTTDRSIWIGKVKELYVYYFGIEILPKLKIHEKNMMKEFWVIAKDPAEIAPLLRREKESIPMSATDNLETNYITKEIMEKFSFPSGQEREGGQEMFPFE
ncbi:MAG: uncharacterized protein A8A55_2865 [Amphiamblys sp. WSBS2006]|nr:MAG: uncharacterized protein A8A55_2865 [Amphiamblys sp. WSBS2006]